ncbi:triacylglycerol lipase [Myxococcus sp. RHSTA-1-4]|uniref:esterase/lipase family protein n=1 Tax=Myxococcus sp. RHSTA-1-4 TaxID=2874601 RepID=UPI001CC0E7B9|nr:hypothetical protein [Myxococcus sp. RHSTA-1-4]MBZ4419828.1 hypothetical protein [Myxococcus sp. RHSTA-1-4]
MAERPRDSGHLKSGQVHVLDGRPGGRDHLVLVPGFGGFDALGSLRYYHGVTEVLRELEPGSELSVHYFPNLPTASVQTRARQLQRWLAALWDRLNFLPADRIHLIGHSTGGLDIRQLLTDHRVQYQQHARGTGGSWSPVLDRIASVQFLSTPHRGTALAYHLSRTRLRRTACRAFLYGAYQSLRAFGERGSGQLGRLGKVLAPSARTPDWVDALLDTLRGTYIAHGSLERATARSSYFELLRWLLDMGTDFNAITDLDPCKPPSGAPASPAHQDEKDYEEDTRFLRERHIRVRSIVTVAGAPPPRRGRLPTLYGVTYGLTALNPPERLQSRTVRELMNPRNERTLRPTENDGFVNSVSQVWPDEAHSYLVEGDHADVIGHFHAPPATRDGDFFAFRQYDLLSSNSDFDEEAFTALWRKVGQFALERAGARRERREPRPRPSATDTQQPAAFRP